MGSTVSSEPAEVVAASPDSLPSSSVLETDVNVEQVLKPAPTVFSYCKSYGKDKVIFMTKEDWDKPPVDLPESFISSLDEEDSGPRGVITKTGEINWGCPCLGNLPYGPCAVPFREAFSCFHYSLADPKGSDCIDNFRLMTECMQKYPNLYPNDKDDDEDDEDDPFTTMDKAEEEAKREGGAKRRPSASKESR